MTNVNYKPSIDTNKSECTYTIFDESSVLSKQTDSTDKPNINFDSPDTNKAFSVLLRAFSSGCNIGLVNGVYYINGFAIDPDNDPTTVLSICCTKSESDTHYFKPDEVLTAADVKIGLEDGSTQSIQAIDGLTGCYAVYGLDEQDINIKIEKTGYQSISETVHIYNNIPINLKVEYFNGSDEYHEFQR